MKVLDHKTVKKFIRMCNDGWLQGWHEGHGGNLSYRLTENDIESMKEDLDYSGEFVPTGVTAASLAGACFLVTGSGKFMRNVEEEPQDCLGIIQLDEKGSAYRTIWGLIGGGRPTSELPTHLMVHEVKKKVSGDKVRVVYHAHPANLIALSFVLPISDELVTRQLWEMEPECAMTFPEGLGVLSWMVPGTAEIAKATCKKMETYHAVLWAQHGIFATGKDFDDAFGLTHTIEKSAQMLVKVLSMTDHKKNAPSAQNFRDMAAFLHLDLDERFLY